ncbi:MAG TPA: conjugal transfer protein TraH [Syntrophales bacterium]|nr:conjugal transfer protein TraH [Syntrophales bacterium]
MFTRWGGRINVTEPGAYDAQTRGFVIGGSLSARVPRNTLQPITWKEPYIKAGCGGIDIFGGSFSFINAEQFVQFLQAIGQNALGYAFSLGLEAICPTCNSVINRMRQFMNDLNKYGMDSCMAAKALVNTAGDAMNLWDLQSCEAEKGKIASGGYDHVAGYLTCAAGAEGEVKQQLRDNALLKTHELSQDNRKGSTKGATTVQALQRSDLTELQRQEITSLIGTWYTKSDEGSACEYAAPTIDLAQLVHGGAVKLLTCGNGSFSEPPCEDVSSTDTNIDGYAKLASDKMMNILNKIKKTPEDSLTEDEKQFINAVPIPAVLTMIRSAAKLNEETAKALINLSAELVGAQLAWHHIEESLELYRAGTENITACGMNKDEVNAQIRTLRASRQELFEKYMKGFEMQVAVIRFLASIDAATALKSRSIAAAIAYRP